MEIILASHNQDKVKEFSAMLKFSHVEIKSMVDYGLNTEIEESGKTYAENALIKAKYVHRKMGGFVLADDSGLSIDILDGYPGVYSSRFAGENTTYGQKIQHLWNLLNDYPQEEWTAAFHCALAFIDLNSKEYIFEAECRGKIIPEMRGQNGFGYDPIFYMSEYDMTTGEMDPNLKNNISHRALAFAKFRDFFHENYFKYT